MIGFDNKHIWHPYTALNSIDSQENLLVKSAKGVYLHLANNLKLIDGMSSWWCVIHGYNHQVLNEAINKQLENMAHIMFGGLTHQPAIDLAKKLLEINNNNFHSIFFADSGSIAVEVALKIALQYQQGIAHTKNRLCKKNHIITMKSGYHGDSLGAMSVSDTDSSVRTLFQGYLPQQIFAESPRIADINDDYHADNLQNLEDIFYKHHHKLAAFIIEPVLQGAGGMRIYSPRLLEKIRQLCDEFSVLLIFDEIATGFGRIGKLFAYQYTNIIPDILCLGKSLSGGYLNIATVLSVKKISDILDNNPPYTLMHGPTFMANPLACTVSLASINLLLNNDWHAKITNIELNIKNHFAKLKEYSYIKDLRILGASGAIEFISAERKKFTLIQKLCVKQGVWIRPFKNLIYIMPPFIINDNQLNLLCQVIVNSIIKVYENVD